MDEEIILENAYKEIMDIFNEIRESVDWSDGDECPIHCQDIDSIGFECVDVRCHECHTIFFNKLHKKIDKIFGIKSECVCDKNGEYLKPGMFVYVPLWYSVGPYRIDSISDDEVIIQYDMSGNLKKEKASSCIKKPENIRKLRDLIDALKDSHLDSNALSSIIESAYNFRAEKNNEQ